MMYNIYSVLDIRSRSVDAVNSPNHVIIANRLLEAYLMGFSLILLVVIDSVHRYIKELVMVTESIPAAKKEKRGL
ncbi:hypothetical protein L1987_49455 [Smallanthus sonchifolius]|uniref:Uncharacterized protein n=1 Tax=Smallanthus sonchifolius TaxID=185202 RepID=A0ACB9FUT2_9ASTR|nr:hypothetical protein L1987_49455 [Smallanthus sonchifolius]